MAEKIPAGTTNHVELADKVEDEDAQVLQNSVVVFFAFKEAPSPQWAHQCGFQLTAKAKDRAFAPFTPVLEGRGNRAGIKIKSDLNTATMGRALVASFVASVNKTMADLAQASAKAKASHDAHAEAMEKQRQSVLDALNKREA